LGAARGPRRAAPRHDARLLRAQAAGARAALARARGGVVARGDRRVAGREGEEREGDAVPRPQAPRRAADEEGAGAMTDSCPFEPNVIDAAASGAWTESLRTHAASCPDCAAAAEVGPWMTSLAKHDDREHILPDPAVLWL